MSSLPAEVVGDGRLRPSSFAPRPPSARVVRRLRPAPAYVTSRRVAAVSSSFALRGPCCAAAKRVSSRFSRTRNVRNSRASRRDRFARVDRRVASSVYVLRICIYTYRVKRFCAPNSFKGSSLIWSDAAREREEGGEGRFPRIFEEHLVALRLSENFRGMYIYFAHTCFCVYIVCVRARSRTFRVPFGRVFSLSKRPPPVGHGKVQRLVTADASNRARLVYRGYCHACLNRECNPLSVPDRVID